MENEIVLKCQSGLLEAFTQLYDLYLPKIYQFIYFKTQHKETAEDLTSLTFMKALKHIEKCNPQKGSFKTWLYQIARNTVIDHYRSLHPTQDLEDAWSLRDSTDLERETDHQLKLEKVKAYLTKLKPEQRELILLRVWGGHSFAEIGEMMGKTEASCKMAFKRTIEKLREDFVPLLMLLLFLK